MKLAQHKSRDSGKETAKKLSKEKFQRVNKRRRDNRYVTGVVATLVKS